jgi:hypothetical protein
MIKKVCNSRNAFILFKPNLCYAVALRTKNSYTGTVFSPSYLP